MGVCPGRGVVIEELDIEDYAVRRVGNGEAERKRRTCGRSRGINECSMPKKRTPMTGERQRLDGCEGWRDRIPIVVESIVSADWAADRLQNRESMW